MLNENYACKSQYIRNINIYIVHKTKKDKKSTGKFVPNIVIHDLMEVFITHDESSPPVPFYLAASKVTIVFTPLRRGVN